MDPDAYLSVQAVDLVEALASSQDEVIWLLDLESGEVLQVDQDLAAAQSGLEDWDNPDHFLPILPLESHQQFELMDAFVQDLPEGEACRALGRALRQPRPFRGFKDTLDDFPSLRERWFKFHDDRMLELAQAWLDEQVPGARLALD
jgi:hypothetical protein